jgi:hypothetical protein
MSAKKLKYAALVGNLSEGFRGYGPYKDFSEASAAHPGPDVWIVSLEQLDVKRKAALFDRVKKHASEEELDEVIHELVSQRASDVNNGGLDSQFDYMEANCGLDWIDERFTYKGER